MIIEPKCPNCGKKVKVKISKVIKLEAKIKHLEKELSELRAVIKFKEQSGKQNPYSNIFGNMF